MFTFLDPRILGKQYSLEAKYGTTLIISGCLVESTFPTLGQANFTYWIKDGKRVQTNNVALTTNITNGQKFILKMQNYRTNEKVTFNDEGVYQCVVFLPDIMSRPSFSPAIRVTVTGSVDLL